MDIQEKTRYTEGLEHDCASRPISETCEKCDEIVRESLHQFYTATDEDKALEDVLVYLAERFGCDRACLFLIRDGKWIDTEFEWCAEGISSQKEQIKHEPLEHFAWRNDFLDEGVVLLRDVEEIRNAHPAAYALMKSRRLSSTVALLVRFEHDNAGVISMENPESTEISVMACIIRKLTRHIKSQLKRRITFHQLEEMSFHDPLTGAYNRNALTDLYKHPLPMKSVGVIFCDVSGLKQVNDTKGHEEGDEMIIQCCHLIRQTIRTDRIYRMGGDEFLALCCDVAREEVEKEFEELKSKIAESRHHIAAGYVWSDEAPLMLESLIAAADQEMYLDKQEYYSTRDYFARMAKEAVGKNHVMPDVEENTAFQKYVKHYYFDAEALLKSLTINNMNQFFFFGDVKKNYFYVSDHMRDRFGFESNLLLNLPHHWEQRICDEEYKRINSQAVEKLFCEKQSSYELLHLVEDVHGNRIWVHNSGTLQWNADKTVPLFLSGRITLQDKDYSIDQISGFQKDYKALVQLENMQIAGQNPAVIGFCLNHFAKINQTERTYYGNMLIYHIGQHLQSQMSGKMTFYRLDGTYFMAILEPGFEDQQAGLLEEIRAVIEEEYRIIEVYDKHPASFAMLRYAKDGKTPQEFLETVCEMIDTAKSMPNLPCVSVSGEQKKEIEQTERMLEMLRKDVQNNMENFRIVVQPAIYIKSGKLAGGESLLRWKYEGRDVLPDELLPLLEREGLLVQTDLWVIEQAISAGVRLRDCAKDFILTFNISGQTLKSGVFDEFIQEMRARYEMKDCNFQAEMDEAFMNKHEEEVSHFTDVCREAGIRIMQKKFGTPSAVFKAGMEKDTEIVKFDISLLDTLDPEEQVSYMKSLVFLCHQFGKKLSITKVEDARDHERAAACGCDYLQGYYYYRPLELSQLYSLLLA